MLAKNRKVFLVTEPIVTCVSIFVSVAYATLYALFASFPIVFQQRRGFTPGQSGLAFLGIGIGIIIGTCASPIQTRLYRRAMAKSPDGKASPEE
jgi:predicted MFS family arabinose efflux permease